MGIVLSACVSSSGSPSQPVPPANLGSTQAAPPVPPAAIPVALPPGYTRHITYSDGRFTLPDGSTVSADPNGGFTISTGAYIPPDGAGGIILPNGARCISDNARGYFCP
ncbi:hypothetical protein BB934_42530 (plasmid) [Microvirga ossetica]|uniref:Uncharacterized protein n=2 Tax=Microvirga ossetica TaxID=1882682 RepID=A0A1B2EY99_9HYPH|nr:hypothetical protein BB934_42530 [Microvirga ossetica]